MELFDTLLDPAAQPGPVVFRDRNTLTQAFIDLKRPPELPLGSQGDPKGEAGHSFAEPHLRRVNTSNKTLVPAS